MRILSRIFVLALTALLLCAVSGPSLGQLNIPESVEQDDGLRLAPVNFKEADAESSADLETIFFDAKTQDGYFEATTALQNLIEQRGDSLVARDEQGSFAVNFATRIFEKIKADPAMLAAYRRRFDPVVSRMLAEARDNHDMGLLLKIWRDYRPSSHAGKALYELGSLALEQGDCGRAAWCLKRAMGRENVPRALCCVRRAEALAAMQDEAGVRALINEMPADLADKRLCVQHKEVSVGEHVRALADKIRHERKPIPDVAIESVIRSIEIPDTGRTQLTEDNDRYYKERMWREEGIIETMCRSVSTPYHACYAENRVCVVHESGMRVFDLDGRQMWHTEKLFSYAVSHKIRPDRYRYDDVQIPTYQEFPVIWGGRVFTLVPSWFEVPLGERGAGKFCPFKIICMDLERGRIRWMTGGLEADEFRPLHMVSFCTPPMCSFGRAYAVGYRAHSNKKVYIYSLFCLDVRNGRVINETELYHSDCAITNRVFAAWLRGRALMPSTDGVRIFITTDDGATICVNSIDGRIEWAVRYPVRQVSDYRRQGEDPGTDYWACEKSFYADGVVLSAAADSRWLFAHDADTGEVLWGWDNKARTVNYVFDVRNSQVRLCGEFMVTLDLKTGREIDTTHIEHPEKSIICGRICASENLIYWPTQRGIMAYDTRNSKLLKGFAFQTMKPISDPDDIAEPNMEYAGNLILAGNRLVAVSERRITFYGPARKPAPETPPVDEDTKEENNEPDDKDTPAPATPEPDKPAPQTP